jgi:hypothetical protein
VALAGVAVLVLLVALAGCGRVGLGTDRPAIRGPLWSVTLPLLWGPVRAAQVVGNVVVVQLQDGVAVLDRASGAVRWRQPGIHGGSDQLFVRGDTVLLSSPDGFSPRLEALDLATGRPRYEHRLTGNLDDPVVTASGPVVVDCPTTYVTDGCSVSRLDPVTGQAAWSLHYPGEVHLTGGVHLVTRNPTDLYDEYVEPFAVPEVDVVLAARTIGEGSLVTGIDARSGTVLPRLPVPPGWSARPVEGGRALLWGAERGCALPVTGYDTTTGSPVWLTPVGQWLPAPGHGYPATCFPGWQPTIVAGRLLAITADERPQILRVATGTVAWTGPVGWHPLGLDGTIVLLATDHGAGDWAAVDIASGATLWRRPAPRTGAGRLAIGDGRAAYTYTVISDDGIAQRLAVTDIHSGASWTATGDNQLLGLARGWVLAGSSGQHVATDDIHQIRLYPT